MNIEEMFKKDINRKIRGVITTEIDEDLIYQELDEYVVTNELLKHFTKFYSSYTEGIMNDTVDMGVWISGFFGSGKSHFLKILSYLLDSNLVVKGKKPLDFFKEDEKIKDSVVLGNMEIAANVDADVILFNIDSKSSVNSSSEKDSILKIFVNVFNGARGYCDDKPFLANLEKQLDEEGKYEDFKDEFYSLSNKLWEEKGRSQFNLLKKSFVQALVNIGYMDYDYAKDLAINEEKRYSYTIEDFAEEIKDYCINKGNNHHVVFLVDEVGQYIADDSKLMLNLQTLVEELGQKCHGKAWVIVTSQQNIDEITKDIKGIDFSKIQGRFKTRLSLSSSNVDEVIRRRILAKNDVAQQVLESEYPEIDVTVNNILTFEKAAEMKKFENAKNYADIYPFVPYQFNLVQYVLTSIRKHSASGKHMADGERSMLALFQESAQAVQKFEDGHLVPFNLFYNAVDEFIDHTHRQVIKKAAENKNLNDFDVEVLKVLFLVKYIKEMKATSKNITTLMISNVDEDIVALNKKVDKSLERLIEQTLIQKNGPVYSFLTDEEQDVNRQIKNIIVDPGEVLDDAANKIFSEIYQKTKYKFSNRYNFLFNQYIDYKKVNNKEYDIGLRVITPKYELDTYDSSQTSFGDENLHYILKGLSESNNEVILYLSSDLTVFDEIHESLQIKKFLTKPDADIKPELRARKQEEYNDKVSRINSSLKSSIKEATIYVKGDKVDISEKNVEDRIDEAMKNLVNKVYSKLNYMDDFAPDKTDIKKTIEEEHQTTFGLTETRCRNALDELDRYISDQSKLHNTITLKSIITKYSKAPYGFINLDIQWLVATLFAQKRISLTLNSNEITIKEYGVDKILDYLTNLNYFEKLLIDIRIGPPPVCLKKVKDILREVYDTNILTVENDELIMDEFKKVNKSKLGSVEEALFEFKILDKYPGKETLEKAKDIFIDIKNKKGVSKFFTYICTIEDELYILGEELEPVLAFFNGSQKNIFKESCMVYDIFESNKNLIGDSELSGIASEIKKIIDMPEPYSNIKDLPELNNSFKNKFDDILDEKRKIILNGIDNDLDSVILKLTNNELKEEFENKVILSFQSLKTNLSSENNIAVIEGYIKQSENIKKNYLNEINKFIIEKSGSQGDQDKEIDINIQDITLSPTIKIKSEKELNDFIRKVQKEIMDKLEAADVINLKL